MIKLKNLLFESSITGQSKGSEEASTAERTKRRNETARAVRSVFLRLLRRRSGRSKDPSRATRPKPIVVWQPWR